MHFYDPIVDDYATLSAIYEIVRKAYARRVMVDREFQRKTNQPVREKIDTPYVALPTQLIEINAKTIEAIKESDDGDSTKVINLIKSIQKHAEDNSDDPVLVLMSERAKAVQEAFENRQATTKKALDSLCEAIKENERRKREQAEKGFDGITYFVYRTLLDFDVENSESVSKEIGKAFVANPLWKESDQELRNLRREVNVCTCLRKKMTRTRLRRW